MNGKPTSLRPNEPANDRGEAAVLRLLAGPSEPLVLKRLVVITNPQGLHMRPAAAFVERASQYQSNITLKRRDRSVNGKSLWELLALAAERGSELLLEVSGADADAALEELADLLALPSMDDTPDGAAPPAPLLT